MAILDLAAARKFLRGSSSVTGGDLADDVLVQLYVDAVDPIIEGHLGGPVAAAARTFRVSGGRRAVLLPCRFRSITSVTENGVTVSSDGYTANPDAGLLVRGTPQFPGCWAGGYRNVEVIAQVGYDPLPANVVLAAQELLKHLWSMRQAPGPGGAKVPAPPNVAIPPRVAQMLGEPDLPGFA